MRPRAFAAAWHSGRAWTSDETATDGAEPRTAFRNDVTHNDVTHNDVTHNDVTHNDVTHK
jgi:hypothetical protein